MKCIRQQCLLVSLEMFYFILGIWMLIAPMNVVYSRQNGRKLIGDPIADVQALLQVSQIVSNDPQNASGS